MINSSFILPKWILHSLLLHRKNDKIAVSFIFPRNRLIINALSPEGEA